MFETELFPKLGANLVAALSDLDCNDLAGHCVVVCERERERERQSTHTQRERERKRDDEW